MAQKDLWIDSLIRSQLFIYISIYVRFWLDTFLNLKNNWEIIVNLCCNSLSTKTLSNAARDILCWMFTDLSLDYGLIAICLEFQIILLCTYMDIPSTFNIVNVFSHVVAGCLINKSVEVGMVFCICNFVYVTLYV